MSRNLNIPLLIVHLITYINIFVVINHQIFIIGIEDGKIQLK